jgi:LacI family transcriptional regulator
MPRSPKLHISQAQIAREVGCSQSLVSKVLNGQHAGLPDQTVKMIWEYARDHGYRPRGINLEMLVAETVATQMVGFVLRSPLRLITESQIFLHAHQGMHDYLAKRNIRTVYLGAEDELDAAELVRSVERQKLVRGLALMGEVQHGFINTLAACRKPVVIVSARHPGLCHSVVSNLPQAAALLVDHLYQLGHRRFGWVGSLHGVGSMLRRKEAVIQALAARGLSLDLSCQMEMAEADRQNGYAACQQLLARHRRRLPTALVCHNAMMARGVVNCAFQRGLDVPRDISVVAIDMTQVCVEEPPQITSAAARPEALGARAAQLIVERSDSPDRGLCEIIEPSELVVRATTARLRAPGRRKK